MKQNQMETKAIGMQGLIDRVKHRSVQDAEKNFHNLMHKTKKESENLEIEDHIVELIKEETKQVGVRTYVCILGHKRSWNIDIGLDGTYILRKWY